MSRKENGFNQIKYQNDYNREKYDRIQLAIPKGSKEKIKKRAEALGMSTNAYITDIINKDLEESSI